MGDQETTRMSEAAADDAANADGTSQSDATRDDPDPEGPDPLDRMLSADASQSATRTASAQGASSAGQSADAAAAQGSSTSTTTGDAPARSATPERPERPEGISPERVWAVALEYRADNFRFREANRKLRANQATLQARIETMTTNAAQSTQDAAQLQQQVTDLTTQLTTLTGERDGLATQLAESRRAVVREAIRHEATQSARKFRDVSDALDKLDLDAFPLVDGNKAPVEAIQAALDKLLTDKPHWRDAAEAAATGANGNANGATGNGATGQGTGQQLITVASADGTVRRIEPQPAVAEMSDADLVARERNAQQRNPIYQG